MSSQKNRILYLLQTTPSMLMISPGCKFRNNNHISDYDALELVNSTQISLPALGIPIECQFSMGRCED